MDRGALIPTAPIHREVVHPSSLLRLVRAQTLAATSLKNQPDGREWDRRGDQFDILPPAID
ncbi:hypothetical protein GCM10023333_13280 [Ferrimonas pelagia]|uniref:Uncharacterized protein n=1 Tax=Ferrimonas pelagia TaxID=1177826 RepID=A0ABP9EIZ8_9GAMM